jgi:hypothetical protein
MAGKVYTSYGAYFAGTEGLRHPASRQVRAYAEGRTANAAGALETANPHPAGTPANQTWDYGWTNKRDGTPKGHCCT